MQSIVCADVQLDLPADLCHDVSLLLDVISPATWNNELSHDSLKILMSYLPDFPDEYNAEEKTRTLEMFFDDKNFRFGTPLRNFHSQLSRGYFNMESIKMKKLHKKILYKEYQYSQKLYHHNLLEEILVRRKYVLDMVYNMPPEEMSIVPWLEPKMNLLQNSRPPLDYRVRKRYFKEISAVKAEAACSSDSSEDENYPEGPGISLNKKHNRYLASIDNSLPNGLSLVHGTHSYGYTSYDMELAIHPSFNPFELSDESLKNILNSHRAKRKKHENAVDLNTRGICLNDVISRAQCQIKRIPHRSFAESPLLHEFPKKKKKNEIQPFNSTLIKEEFDSSASFVSESDEDSKNIEDSFASTKSRIKSKNNSDVISETVKEEELDVQYSESVDSTLELSAALESIGACLAPELTQETHVCYFSLIRDIILSTPEHRMGKSQLLTSVKVWQESAVSSLNEWYPLIPSWIDCLASAINFLCGRFGDVQPVDFVPYIEYKADLKSYQWIGAGRDTDRHLDAVNRFWFANRTSFSSDWLDDEAIKIENDASIPPPRCPTTWTVRPSSVHEVESYRQQEKIRYEKPHKPFTYRMHSYESVVGPVKGVYSSQSCTSVTKPRGHSLLVDERPPYVTLLSLVRDAVARLPNGEGTRSDIVELLKESQYLAPLNGPTAESMLNTVVSGALDRLHSENDPCVKYDSTRKLWIYLHRNRNEDESERLHHLNGPNGSKSKRTASKRSSKGKTRDVRGPPNIVLEPADDGSVQINLDDFGSAVDNLEVLPAVSLSSDSVQTIQVSTASGVQTFRVSLPGLNPTISKISSGSSVAQPSSPVMPKKSFQIVTSQSDGINDEAVLRNTVSKSNRTFQRSQNGSVPTKSDFSSRATYSESITSSDTASGIVTQVVPLSKASTQKVGHSISGQKYVSSGTVLNVAPHHHAKIVSSGNKLYLQGGKVVHTVAGTLTTSGGKQVIANVISGQQLVSVENIAGGKTPAVQGNLVAIAGGKNASGNLIHFGTGGNSGNVVGGTTFQKLTLVSPQGNPIQVNASTQRLVLASSQSTGSGKVDVSSGKSQVVQTLHNLPPGSHIIQTIPNLGTVIPSKIPVSSHAKGGSVATQKVSQTTAKGIRLHSGVVNASNAGSFINIGGKQVFLSPKVLAQAQQVVVAGPGHLSSDGNVIKGTASNTAVVVASGSSGQQIVLPATAIQGSQLGVKAFQTLKVVPAGHMQGSLSKGKPLLARIVSPSSARSAKVISCPSKPPETEASK